MMVSADATGLSLTLAAEKRKKAEAALAVLDLKGKIVTAQSALQSQNGRENRREGRRLPPDARGQPGGADLRRALAVRKIEIPASGSESRNGGARPHRDDAQRYASA
jgi:hypothetical protein